MGRTVELGGIAKIKVIIVMTNLSESEITTHTRMGFYFTFITEKKVHLHHRSFIAFSEYSKN